MINISKKEEKIRKKKEKKEEKFRFFKIENKNQKKSI